jgi:hypothetical protein
MRKKSKANGKLLVCVENKGYPVALEKRKIYVSLSDPIASKHGQVRVIDESGSDYLYPKSFFLPVTLPQSARKAVLRAA